MSVVNQTSVIAITGGIGSGKTTVINWMKKHEIQTISADCIAHKVLQPGTDGLKKIVKHFGNSILQNDGTLNRKLLRNTIFKNYKEKKWLEDLTHPLIQSEIKHQITQLKQQNNALIIIEIPLLTQATRAKYINSVWVVDCCEETQCQRAMKRDRQTKSEIMAIIRQQPSRKTRLNLADLVINSEQSLESLYKDLRHIVNKTLLKSF